MHLIVHQMMQLQHMHITDCNGTIERLAGPSVIKRHLAGTRKTGKLQHILDLVLRGSIEHGRRERHAVL